MSDLFELLTAVRLNYVGQFELALQELRETGQSVIVEPPALDDTGELARDGALNLPGRYDLAVQEGDSATPSLFSPARMLEFQPMEFAGGGLAISIAPFSWDGVQLAITGDPQAVSTALAQWFENAIGAPEGVDPDGLQHAAHFLSDPVVEGTISRAHADFGTADVDVVIDLFDRLRHAGASRVELGLPQS